MISSLSDLIEDTLSQGKPIEEYFISEVIIGMRYTGILLSNGTLGITYTLNDQSQKKGIQDLYLKQKFHM